MKRTAVFAGSFDPITLGHTDIINRALPLFDRLIIGIGVNSRKKYLFPLAERKAWIDTLYQSEEKVEVMDFTGLTVDFCRQHNAQFLLRGLRNSQDFGYEQPIAQLNHQLSAGIETIFLSCLPAYSHISSTIVREILINNGDASPMLPGMLSKKICDLADSLHH